MLRRMIKACHHFALSLSSPRHKKSIKTSPNRNVLFIFNQYLSGITSRAVKPNQTNRVEK